MVSNERSRGPLFFIKIKQKDMPKVAVFIDHSNIFKNIRRLKHIDPSWTCLYDPLELSKKIAGNRELSCVRFYCVRPPAYLLKEDQWHQDVHALENKYYAAIEKMQLLKVKYGYITGPKNYLQEKNVDTQLCSDLIMGAALKLFDIAIIIANDGDYIGAIEKAKLLGVKIELLFFRGYFSNGLDTICDLKRRARKSYFQPLVFDGDKDILETICLKK